MKVARKGSGRRHRVGLHVTPAAAAYGVLHRWAGVVTIARCHGCYMY